MGLILFLLSYFLASVLYIHMFSHTIVHIAHITLQVGLMFFSTGQNAQLIRCFEKKECPTISYIDLWCRHNGKHNGICGECYST